MVQNGDLVSMKWKAIEGKKMEGQEDANDLLVHLPGSLGAGSSGGAFVSTHSVKAVHRLHYPE